MRTVAWFSGLLMWSKLYLDYSLERRSMIGKSKAEDTDEFCFYLSCWATIALLQGDSRCTLNYNVWRYLILVSIWKCYCISYGWHSGMFFLFRLNGIGNNVCNPGTATRSLPELPVGAAVCGTSNRSEEVSSNFISYSGLGDTNSDLYATLEEHKFGR